MARSAHRSHQHSTVYHRIWETVRLIPEGKVATYGQIANMTGLPPGHARMVGYALHGLPDDSDVPWHRVINAQGRISLPKGGGACALQRKLLRREGIVFRNGRIDLGRFGISWLWRDSSAGRRAPP